MADGATVVYAGSNQGACTRVWAVVKTPKLPNLGMEGMVSGNGRRARSCKRASAGILFVVLAGCAGNTGAGGDPGPQALSGGDTCQSVRADLNRLDKEGVPALVERQSSGQKLSGAQKDKADLYNRLLNKYLGARCHV